MLLLLKDYTLTQYAFQDVSIQALLPILARQTFFQFYWVPHPYNSSSTKSGLWQFLFAWNKTLWCDFHMHKCLFLETILSSASVKTCLLDRWSVQFVSHVYGICCHFHYKNLPPALLHTNLILPQFALLIVSVILYMYV